MLVPSAVFHPLALLPPAVACLREKLDEEKRIGALGLRIRPHASSSGSTSWTSPARSST
jgi:hypothetical protein